ncbi:MAG: trehalose-phosphatase [Alcaligenaceae bacterium]|nr:trehalose-phosphatase [Alcaligenaceae bacterium]
MTDNRILDLCELQAEVARIVLQAGGAGGFKGRPPLLRLLPGQLALFLDVDGTLAPITERPEMTRVPLETRRILLELQGQGVALAALSGRPLDQVRRLLYPVSIPMAGSHGAQFSLGDNQDITLASPPPPDMVSRLQAGVDALPSVWLERKPASLAVHWRQAPRYQEQVARLVAGVLAGAPRWQQVQGHSVHELRQAGHDKGAILKRIMRQPEFNGRWPLAIGDDRTDEDAFKAALELGGGAIRVGAGQDTAAPWALADVPSLAQWLSTQNGLMRA